MNPSELQSAIAQLIDPFTGRSLAQDKVSIDIQANEGRYAVTLTLGYPCSSQVEAWQAQVDGLLAGSSAHAGASAKVDLRHRVVAHQVQGGVQTIPGVKNVIAVGSGKGGVGKSTVSANLALALAAQGARVGLLDADIYGPSVPTLMGVNHKPDVVNGQFMKPLSAHGLQLMSVGFMVPAQSALVWRGPMAVQALEQLFRQTAWDDLDYLMVDLPPGTGDIQLSLAQKMPVTGAVIVTTPQDLALADARKAVAMFEKVSVPVLGVVENMAMYCCPNCGHQEAIFGSGGGASMASSMGLDNLGGLPLHARIRADADAGCPTVAAAPESDLTQLYTEVAMKVAAKVAMRAKDYSQKFPSIRVSTDT
jgi:ATP-binding protein involved in chromosome partitioning